MARYATYPPSSAATVLSEPSGQIDLNYVHSSQRSTSFAPSNGNSYFGTYSSSPVSSGGSAHSVPSMNYPMYAQNTPSYYDPVQSQPRRMLHGPQNPFGGPHLSGGQTHLPSLGSPPGAGIDHGNGLFPNSVLDYRDSADPSQNGSLADSTEGPLSASSTLDMDAYHVTHDASRTSRSSVSDHRAPRVPTACTDGESGETLRSGPLHPTCHTTFTPPAVPGVESVPPEQRNPRNATDGTVIDVHGLPLTHHGEYMTMNDQAHEQDRFLFDMHKMYRGNRGRGMWENITNRYSERFPFTGSTASLQMKYTRSMRRCCVWPQAAADFLVKMYLEYERERFNKLAIALKESPFAGDWDWKASDVEAFLIRAGFEEYAQDEDTGHRRRRRGARRRSAQNSQSPQGGSSQKALPQEVLRDPNPGTAWTEPGSHPQYSLPGVPAPQMPPRRIGLNGMPLPEIDRENIDTSTLRSMAFTEEQNRVWLGQLDAKYGREAAEDTMEGNDAPLKVIYGTPTTTNPSPSSRSKSSREGR